MKMRFSNIKIVARWEFIKTLLSPTFLILTFIIPIFIVISGSVGYLTQKIAHEERLNIAVVDDTGEFYPYLEEQIKRTPMDITRYQGDIEALKNAVEAGDFDGFLLFHEEMLLETGLIPYYVADARKANLEVMRGFLNNPITIYRLDKLNLSEEQIALATTPVEITPRVITGEETSLFDIVIPIAVAMILIFAVIFSGQILMYGVIREKRNRVVELLLSSISSFDLMLGKILGFGALGLIQIAIWVTVGLTVGSTYIDISSYISPSSIIPLLLIFLFGYLMLASLFAAVGATMKDAEGGSQMQGLVIMVPMAPLFLSGPIFMNPDAIWVKILSYIPPFSPIGALIRSGATDIPLWEMSLILLALLVSSLLFVILGAKVFEGSILQYERSVSFKEVRRMLKK